MRRITIYTVVIVAMAASIAMLGFAGPIVISVALDVMARRKGIYIKR